MSSKLQNLTATTTLSSTDDLYTVRDPSGTPVDRKISFGDFKNSFNTYTIYADDFAGSDMGDQINTAYAALPSTGGIIVVPGGAFSFSTPIVLNTAEKFVSLRGAPAGGTTLTYTGTGTTVALTYNISKAITAGHGITDLLFVGPGSTGQTVGIQLGGLGADDGKGFAGGMLRNVDVSGFGCNILIGNNAFIITLDNVVSNFGGILLYEKGGAGAGATNWTVNGANTINAGENMRCLNCTFADANNKLFSESTARYAVHLQTSGLTDWNFIGCSFDDAELYIDKTGGTSNSVHIMGSHFENPAADSILKYSFITTLSGATTTSLDLVDTTFIQDATTSVPDQIINAGCQVSMTGCSVTKNSGAATTAKFVNFQNATTGNNLRFLGNTNFNSGVTNIAGTLLMTGGEGTINGVGIYSFISGAGVLNSKNFNTVLDASTFLSDNGNDYGAAINAAYAYINTLGLKSGIITVPSGVFSYSTPIVFGTNGVRVSLRGAPGGGTNLTYTGGINTVAVTVNTGIQGTGIDHTSYEAIRDITFTGPSTSSTNPRTGVYLGGSNGAAGAVLTNVNIQTFGIGLYSGAKTYHTAWFGGVIRNCAQLIYVATASNSGEALHFYDGFFVDSFDATYSTTNGIQFADSGSVSALFSGCSFDDTQVRIGQANNVTFVGCHFENPGQANWGSYVYIVIDNNIATNVNITGSTFWNSATTNAPSTYITNGGTLTLHGSLIRNLGGSTVTRFVTLAGSGRVTWSSFGIVGSAVTNVTNSVGTVLNGFANQAGNFYSIDTSAVITATSPIFTTPTLGVATATQISTPVISPTADSTDALDITASNGTTKIVTIDTTNSRVGILSNPPTHTLTLGSTSTGLSSYNTSDQTTNYERVLESWVSNSYTLATSQGGTGTQRSITISGGPNSSAVFRNSSDLLGHFTLNSNLSGTANVAQLGVGGSWNNTAAQAVGISLVSNANQTSTGGYDALFVSIFESGSGSGARNLMNIGTNSALNGTGTHTPFFKLDESGHPFFATTNTATGTTGAQTINKASGTVNFAATATSLVVTNSLVTTSSIILAVVRTNDTTAVIKNVVPGSGSFTIILNAAATAETSVGFFVIN